MKRSSIKFLHRVRIHGGEFDASARAMHRDGMTSSFQAAVEIVSVATNERKQMSTKTTFKRIALVTVAALGFGVMSIVPSQATINADSVTLSSATATQTNNETKTATSAIATVSFFGAQNDSMSVTAALISAPAGNTALPHLVLTETSSATAGDSISDIGDSFAANNAVKVIATTSTAQSTAKFAVFMAAAADHTTAPVKTGTYVVKLTPATIMTSGALVGSTAQTLTITVTADAKLDTVVTAATVILNKGETSSATADDSVTHSKSVIASPVAAATITVATTNAGAFATSGESFTAVLTGPGTLGSGANTVDGSMLISGPNSSGRAITVQNGHVVQIFPDGSAGVATVTISSAAGIVLATKKITFFGAITALKATAVKTVIGAAATAGTILVVATDAAGVEVQSGTINVFSSATTIISNAYTACAGYTAATATVGAGFLCSVTGVKAGSATIKATTLTSATDTTAGAVTSDGVSIRVGSTSPASVTVTTDKASYIPGEKATVTVSLFDKDGLALADGTYTSIFAEGGIAADYTLGSGSDTMTTESVINLAKGVKTYSIFMPVAETTVKLSWTTGSVASAAGTGLATANQAVDGSVSVAVVSSSGSAATDAANEATDAANAATDAANAAAEAADAATAAAQDAADAVAALSTEVATLIAALKKQITSLTNLVIKIQKKVKA